MAGQDQVEQVTEARADECFIVGVIGQDGTEQRSHANWFFNGIVQPVFSKHFANMQVRRADHMQTPGIISTQIIDKLLNARLVIADLTYLNPNAFYEIGIRHMAGLPIVHVHKEGETIPFDISTFSSMKYSTREYHHLEEAQANLRAYVTNALKPDHVVENPVTQARGRRQFELTASEPDRVLHSQLEALQGRITQMESVLARVTGFPSTVTWGDLHGHNPRHDAISVGRQITLSGVDPVRAKKLYKAEIWPLLRSLGNFPSFFRETGEIVIDDVGGLASEDELLRLANAAATLGFSVHRTD